MTDPADAALERARRECGEAWTESHGPIWEPQRKRMFDAIDHYGALAEKVGRLRQAERDLNEARTREQQPGLIGERARLKAVMGYLLQQRDHLRKELESA